MSEKTKIIDSNDTESKKESFEPKILGFLCNWCAYAGADLAGVSRCQFPPNVRFIRVMCSSRVDPAFIFRAFGERIDGVFVGGCHLADCHYIDGNYGALKTISLCKRILEHVGVNSKRLKLEWISAAEGIRFAGVISGFVKELKELGPLYAREQNSTKLLRLKLQAAEDIVPYLKLVEGEKFKLRFSTEAEYGRFFEREDVKGLFDELVIDKLNMRELLLLLQEQLIPFNKIAETLSLSPSEMSRLLNTLINKGWLKFDENTKGFILPKNPQNCSSL